MEERMGLYRPLSSGAAAGLRRLTHGSWAVALFRRREESRNTQPETFQAENVLEVEYDKETGEGDAKRHAED